MLGTVVFLLLTAAGSDGETDRFCALIGTSAAMIMETRQRGEVGLTELMRAAAADPGEQYELMRGLILDAYAQPQWGIQEMRQRAVREFRNRAELECYRTAGGNPAG